MLLSDGLVLCVEASLSCFFLRSLTRTLRVRAVEIFAYMTVQAVTYQLRVMVLVEEDYGKKCR